MTGLVVAAAILDDLCAPRRLLAARRSSPPELAGSWELPGGKVEPDEDAAAALHREISEELGVDLQLGTTVEGPLAGDWPINEQLRLRVWRAVLVTGAPIPLADHDELRWVGPAEARELAWLPADVPIVAALGLGRRRG